MHLVIRRYHPSDKHVVCALFRDGIQEHIWPCFCNAMSSGVYLAITLALCLAGFLLGSVPGALVLPGLWAGLVFYCCHTVYASYVRDKLRTDMRDIEGSYLSGPDDHFWVAEAEVDGTSQVLGTVAVVAKQSGGKRYGELFRLILSPSCRRMGLGTRLTQTVIDFCKERGLSEVVLETSSTQTAAVKLYTKMGFSHLLSHKDTHAPSWILMLTKVTVLKMGKQL